MQTHNTYSGTSGLVESSSNPASILITSEKRLLSGFYQKGFYQDFVRIPVRNPDRMP
jgi:hypothetical protein